MITIDNDKLLSEIKVMRIMFLSLSIIGILTAAVSVYTTKWGALFPAFSACFSAILCFIRHETLSIRFEVRQR